MFSWDNQAMARKQGPVVKEDKGHLVFKYVVTPDLASRDLTKLATVASAFNHALFLARPFRSTMLPCKAYFVGAMSRPIIAEPAQRVCFLGVRFEVGRAYPFLESTTPEASREACFLPREKNHDQNGVTQPSALS
jgi:hypothetical protein